MRKIEEGECRWIEIVEVIEYNETETMPIGNWLEVFCRKPHKWKCGHRHTRWGPVLRCVARHVASMVDEDRSYEVDDPVRSESEQVTSESPSAGS